MWLIAPHDFTNKTKKREKAEWQKNLCTTIEQIDPNHFTDEAEVLYFSLKHRIRGEYSFQTFPTFISSKYQSVNNGYFARIQFSKI